MRRATHRPTAQCSSEANSPRSCGRTWQSAPCRRAGSRRRPAEHGHGRARHVYVRFGEFEPAVDLLEREQIAFALNAVIDELVCASHAGVFGIGKWNREFESEPAAAIGANAFGKAVDRLEQRALLDEFQEFAGRAK